MDKPKRDIDELFYGSLVVHGHRMCWDKMDNWLKEKASVENLEEIIEKNRLDVIRWVKEGQGEKCPSLATALNKYLTEEEK